MAGGTWIDQNKVLPGVYINYSSAPSTLATMGERGVVCIGKQLNWGEEGKVIVINDPSECFEKLGYDQMDDHMIWLRQLLLGTNRTSGASKVLVWRLDCTGAAAATGGSASAGTKASATLTWSTGSVNIQAKSEGNFGNGITVMLQPRSSTEVECTITKSSTTLFSKNNATSPSDLTNDYVDFTFSSDDLRSFITQSETETLAGGEESVDGLSITAQDKGTRGNDISVIVTADPDNSASKAIFYVQTLVSGKLVDTQTLKADAATVALSGLVDNAWVKFTTKTGNAFASNITLTGGADGSLSASAYSDFMSAMELEAWNVLAYGGDNDVTKSSLSLFVKRLSNDEGKKVQAVLSNYPSADDECVISVYPQVITDNTGHTFSAEEMVCWVAGCTAGANVNESLTYAAHPDAVEINPVLTQSQQIDAINAGQFALFEEFGSIKNIQDNNTFTSFAATKGKQFRKNRVIRTLFGICNDSYKTFSMYYVGNTNNDAVGRGLLKAELLNLLLRYQGNGALQNVVEDDVVVSPGQESDAVLIEMYIQPVDSVEKIYINITIS